MRKLLGVKLFQLRQYSPRPLVHSRIDAALPHPAPRIAIVTPSMNHAVFIGRTIDSVLGQQYPDLAYHVQDGGSTDGTLELLRKHPAAPTWRSEKDNGQAAAINAGFRVVEGDIMAYLNSDDVLLPGSLARVARFFSEQPRVDLVYSHRIIIDEDDLEVGRWVLPPHDPSALRWADYVPQETMFWRRSVWERLGGLDESLAFAMDWDFILRAQEAGFRLSRLSTFLACFRIHSSQKTTSLSAVGEAESAQLRRRYLGYNPSSRQVTTAIRKYLYHHALLNRLHRASLLTYG